jgi:gluconolactonase
VSAPIDRRTLIAAAGAALVAGPALSAATEAPVPPRIRRLSPKLDRVIAPQAEVETIATGIQWAEGPVWVRPGDYLLFSDPPANLIRRWTRAEGVRPFLYPSGKGGTDPKLVREPGSNGLAMDHQGRLLIADSGTRAITRVDLATRQKTVLVDRYQGKRFSSPNDLHVAKSGAIYFTDPPYGFAQGDQSPLKELPYNGVYRWMEGGEAVLIDGELTLPNGIALSPDETRLYVSVSDEKAPRIMVYDLDAKGMPKDRKLFLDAAPMHAKGVPGVPDGMKVAADGTMFCSGPGGMMILTPEAEPIGLIEDGKPIANCAFGEAGDTLFLTSSDRVFRLPLLLNGWRA